MIHGHDAVSLIENKFDSPSQVARNMSHLGETIVFMSAQTFTTSDPESSQLKQGRIYLKSLVLAYKLSYSITSWKNKFTRQRHLTTPMRAWIHKGMRAAFP